MNRRTEINKLHQQIVKLELEEILDKYGIQLGEAKLEQISGSIANKTQLGQMQTAQHVNYWFFHEHPEFIPA